MISIHTLGANRVQGSWHVKFPLPPLFAVNEIVYLIIPGQNQPAGPFVVSASLDNKRYRIRRQDNGQEHPTTVTEERMVVPAT